jgi:BlaI family transcriptional regulator, penicillinase repressor
VERITEAEWAVMEVLWAEHPRTATEIAEAILSDRNWTIATVKTLLSRLMAKGALDTQADGRRFLYSPAVDRGECVSGESRRLVNRLFGGRLSPLVAHFAEAETLSAEDIAEIEALLNSLKASK